MVFSCDAEACYVGYMKNDCPGLHVSNGSYWNTTPL
jgi:hypothetical protein